MSGIFSGFVGTDKSFSYPLFFYSWAQCETNTLAHGHKEKPVPSLYRVLKDHLLTEVFQRD